MLGVSTQGHLAGFLVSLRDRHLTWLESDFNRRAPKPSLCPARFWALCVERAPRLCSGVFHTLWPQPHCRILCAFRLTASRMHGCPQDVQPCVP
jgi:hypothetical protein